MNKIVKLIAKPFMQCLSSVFPSCLGRWTNNSFALMLTAFWLVGIPAGAKSINTISSQSNMVAVADTSMVAYIEKKTGIQIPAEYRNKIDSIFKDNYPHIKVEIDGINSWEFTVDFVLNEMKSDWSISKDNQFLFILDSFTELLSGEGVYDGEDGDSKRLEEFEKALDNIDVCSKRYKEGIVPFVEKQKAEYRRQIAENERQIAENERQIAENERQIAENERQIAENEQQIAENEQQIAENEQQIAENERQIAEYDQQIAESQKRIDEALKQSAENIKIITKGSNEALALFKELYPFFKEHPGDERLKKFKSNAQELIRICKKYGVDYKAVLSAEILKFYGIEE